MWTPDEEVRNLRKAAGLTNRDLANLGDLSPSMVCQCVSGFLEWPPGARSRVVKGLKDIIARRQEASEKVGA
jgi:predicted transcriptional regulator